MLISWTDVFDDLKQQPSMTALAEIQRAAESEVVRLRDSAVLNPQMLVKTLYQAGQCALLTGQGHIALDWFGQALLIEPDPLLRIAQAQALYFNGEYRLMRTALDLLQGVTGGSPLVAPLSRRLRGLNALDQGNLLEAQEALTVAEKTLRDKGSPFNHFEAQLSLIEALTRYGSLTEAQSLLNALDEDLKRAKHQWLRPDWWARQSHIALARGDMPGAEKAARKGLGSVNDHSSSRTLSELYRLLAMTLGRTLQGIEDARDARQRAVDAARVYSSRLGLARALQTIGLHTKLFSTKTTDRARGSGFIYEAERLYQQMELPLPPTDVSYVPFL